MEEQWWRFFETDFGNLNSELQRYFYNSYYQFAYKEIIFLLKDHAFVEDIIQESFLKVSKKRRQLKDLASGKKWAKRIIRNQMIDSLKSNKNHYWISLEVVYNTKTSTALGISDVNVETTVEDTFRNQMLHEEILELKPDYQAVLLKYYMDEKSYKEMALELGMDEQVIAQRLVRARRALLKKFSRKWSDDDE
nr:sigma-70 family RNA polymerase sigma factor [Paenibacillus xylanexedens]